ncbi:MAG TPA: hypothetical protein VI168_12490 [Croceibacterium sp.]
MLDAEPLIADFGDVLPFMARFGETAFALDQVERAREHLSNGLYREPNGRVRLFSNHDWLLGLIELHELTGERSFLDAAAAGARSIIEQFERGGLLLDELPALSRPRTLLQRSSAFNLGYVELLVDLHVLTGDVNFLDAARRISRAYARTDYFQAHGVLGTVFCSWSRTVDRAASRAAQMRSLLFKDNTNGIWSLLALHLAQPDPALARTIERWIAGFEAAYWNGGDVHLWRTKDGPRDVALRSAFASLDLLCDLHLAGFGRAMELGTAIGDRWLAHQWSNGLFPETPGGVRDHVDCNTDMSVSLMKLAGITGEARFAESARRSAHAVVALHETEAGLVLSVGPDGAPVDSRIVVKYQSLALKLALLPAEPAALIADADLRKLLRDR